MLFCTRELRVGNGNLRHDARPIERQSIGVDSQPSLRIDVIKRDLIHKCIHSFLKCIFEFYRSADNGECEKTCSDIFSLTTNALNVLG